MEKLPKARNKIDVPKTEEKKLTDEQIINALKVVKKETLAYEYDKEQRRFEYVTGKEILDLIHRLQDENERLKCNSYTTSWKGKFFEAKKEIDNMQDVIFALEEEKRLLKKEIETQRKIIEYQDGLPDLVEQQKAEIERLMGSINEFRQEVITLNNEKLELQKQVDELKDTLELQKTLYNRAREDGYCTGYKSGVKDTAKEICDLILEHWEKKQFVECDWLRVTISERYGVEVE